MNKKAKASVLKSLTMVLAGIVAGSVPTALYYSYQVSQKDNEIARLSQVVPASPAPAGRTCTHYETSTDALLVDTNEYRLSQGLQQMPTDRYLSQYADLRAKELDQTKDLTHASKYGDVFQWMYGNGIKDPYLATYTGSVGEVISESDNSCQAVDGWILSPTHNDYITRKDAAVGVGASGRYYVEEIGITK